MKLYLLPIVLVAVALTGCSKDHSSGDPVADNNTTAKEHNDMGTAAPGDEMNPFYSDFDTPFGIPPFDSINEAHYLPAVMRGMEEQNESIAKIVANTEAVRRVP